MAATMKETSDSTPRQAGSSSQVGLQLHKNSSTQADDSDSDAIVIEEDSSAQEDNSDDNLPVSFASSGSVNGLPDGVNPVHNESADESSTKKLRSSDVPPVNNESADESSAKKKQSGAPFRVDSTILANVSCTACSRQINPYKNGALQKHPELKVIICKNCEKFLSSGEISKDADGSDEQCRWCGEGGRLLICDECNSAFCKSCVMRNFGRSVFNNIDSQDDWLCYLCNKEPLKPLHDNYHKIKATLKALHKKEKSKSVALANGGTPSSGKLNGSRHNGKKAMPASKPTESSENSLPSSAAFFSISDLNVTQENVGVVLEKVFTATNTFKDVVHVLCQQSQAVSGVGALVQHRRQQHAKAFVKSVQQYLRSLKTILTESLPLPDNSEVEGEVILNNRKKPPSTVESAAAPPSSRRSSAAKKDANLETVSKKNCDHSRTASPLDSNTSPAVSVNDVDTLGASEVNSGDRVTAVNGHVPEQTLDSQNLSKDKSKESSSEDTNPAPSVKIKKFSVRITSLDKKVADIVVKNLEAESQSESKEKNTDKTQTCKEKEVVKKSSSEKVSKSAEVSSPVLMEDDSDQSDSEKSRSKTAKNKCRPSRDSSPTSNVAEGSTRSGPFPDSSEGPVQNEEAVQEESVQEEAVQEEAVQEESVQEESVQEESVQEESVLPPTSEPSSVAEDENLAAKFDLIKELADEMIRKDSENDNERNGGNISEDKDDVSLSSRLASMKDSKTETSKNTKKHKKSASSAEESGPSKTKRKSHSKKKPKVKGADTKQAPAGLTHDSSSSDLLMDDDDDGCGRRDQPATRRRRKTRKDRNNKKSPEKNQTSEKLKETSDEETEDEEIDKEIKKLSKMPTIRKRKVADIYGSGDEATEKDPDESPAPEQQTAKKAKTAGSKDPDKKVDYEDLSSDGNDKNHEDEDETEDEEAGLPISFQAGGDAVEEQGSPLDENEIAKNRLLEDMESDKDDASSDNNSGSDSSHSHDNTGSDKKKTKEPNPVKKEDKTANSEDSDVDIGKRKQIRSKLLDAKLSDSDSDIGQPRKKQKEDDKSSNSSPESDTTSDDDGSDDSFDISEDDDDDPKSKKKNKKKEKKKRGKGKKKGTDDSEESSDEDKKKKGKKKKLKRIKKMSDSSDNEDKDGSDKDENEDENDDDDPNSSKAGKRKQIRKVMSNKSLEDATRAAARAEEKRRKRVAAKQREFNVETMTDENNPLNTLVTTKLVLEPGKEEGDEPLIQVNKKLIRKLKPHQVEAVQFMWDCLYESVKRAKKEDGAGCILAHCMGLGKTLSVVSFVHTVLKHHKLLKHRTCLIVSPLNTVLNWKNEWTMWLDSKDQLEVWELASCKQNLLRARALKDWQESGGIMIIGYEMYRNLTTGNRCRNKKQKAIFQETLVNPGPDLVVCDEGHILKNENSAISKAMNQMKTKRRVVLTGTPLQNNLTEYHCMLSFVKPNLLGTRKEFTNRFISPIQNGQCTDSTPKDVKLMKARAHILHEMLAGCVQRRDYSALTKFLPPKQEYVIFVRLTDIQIELYEKYLELTGQGVDGIYTNKGARMFTDYQNLMKIWTHPWVLKLAEIRDELKGKFDDEDEDSFIEDGSEGESSESTPSSSSEDDKSNSSAGEGTSKAKPNPQRSGTRRTRAKARREAGEDSDPEDVIAEWKAKANGEVEAVKEETDKLVTRDWWASYVAEDDQLKLELSNKLTLLFEILRMSEEIGDKVLVFSQSILSLNIIESFLEVVDSKHQQECEQMTEEEQEGRELFGRSWTKNLDYYRMDGTNNAQQRQAWATSFNDPENYRARLFLISTRAGGLGINLVAANRVIIFDASWNPSHDVQSIFRVYRFGQTKPCYIYRFLAQGTMEEKIYERQVTKLSLSQRVVDEHQIERHFSANDLKELYNFRPDRWDDGTDKPTLSLPKDPLLAEILTANRPSVVSFHEHDSLLENQVEQTLTEEEKKAAWEEYENEKKGIGKGPGPMMAAAQFLSQEQISATVQALKQQLPGVSEDLFQLHLQQALRRQVQMKQEEMRRMDLLGLQEMNIMNMMRQNKQQQPGGAGFPQAMQNMPPWMQLQYFRALQQQQHKPKVGNHSGSAMAMNLLKAAPVTSISNKPEEAIDLDDN